MEKKNLQYNSSESKTQKSSKKSTPPPRNPSGSEHGRRFFDSDDDVNASVSKNKHKKSLAVVRFGRDLMLSKSLCADRIFHQARAQCSGLSDQRCPLVVCG